LTVARALTPEAALAQAAPPSPSSPARPPSSANAPPAPGSNKPADRAFLLDALKAAPDEAAASQIEARLRQMWLEAGSPAVTLLMSRGLREVQAGQPDAAIDTFSDALALDPDLVAGYHQRALARFRAGDSAGAIRDLQEVLRREPRSFAALRSLSDIAAAREDWKAAYAAWQKLLEVDPKTPNGTARLQDLKRRALGEEA
ncbi:MAG: tetratricopeptide repeat protein, partial [Rhodospirillales bacterium]|nr:tetratricopeptide repeat protein [Rhodospirillales bacterium]